MTVQQDAPRNEENIFPADMDLAPVSRWPTTLAAATQEAALAARAPDRLPTFDIVCMPSFLFERSSPSPEVARELARHGHRIIRTGTSHLPAAFLDANLLPDQMPAWLIGDMEAVRRENRIATAAIYADEPRQALLALQVGRLLGWPTIYHVRAVPRETSVAEARIERTVCEQVDVVWDERAHQEMQGSVREWAQVEPRVRATFPRVALIMATCNNLVFPKLCLDTVIANTEYPNYEIVVVDNGSTDGTERYLRDLADRYPHVRVIWNSENVGFARATNQGLEAAEGDILVLLNSDTIVPPGWLTRVARHLSDPTIGFLGPTSNRVSNEAQVEASYRTYGELIHFAAQRMWAEDGHSFDIPMLVMFCAAMRRNVWHEIGPLDERFGIGMFEDDDYTLRMHNAGYRTVCAEDVFVHHFGEATIARITGTQEWQNLFHTNRRIFEEKWGVAWENRSGRRTDAYEDLVDRIHRAVVAAVPQHSQVLMVSKGDPALVTSRDYRIQHFPHDGNGGYLGHYPADSEEVITLLEAQLDDNGYLVVPETSLWWLDHYKGLREYLERTCRPVAQVPDTCLIFAGNDVETC
jgi:GT2 family glycosyltransferase